MTASATAATGPVTTGLATTGPATGHRTGARPAGVPLIEVRGLTVDYGAGPAAVRAVTDASLTLTSRTVLGLAGESGSGKSALAGAMTGLLRAPGRITGGEVLVHGPARDGSGPRTLDLLAAGARQLSELRWPRVAALVADPARALSPMMTIGTHLAAVLHTYVPELDRPGRRERAGALLEMVGIRADRLSRYPHQLTDEMRQRVTIAMALALEPAVVIMDELAAELDGTALRRTLRELTRLQESLPFSVLVVTSDMPLLAETADTIVVMNAGRLIEAADAAELSRVPRHPEAGPGRPADPRSLAGAGSPAGSVTVPRPRALPHLVGRGDLTDGQA